MGKPAPLGYKIQKSAGGGSRRSISGAYTQITPTQAQELRESFALLDKDGDGVLSKVDLQQTLMSLGQDPSDEYLTGMLGEMPSPLNFASYLTALSSHLCDISPREDLLGAFGAFDENDDGKIDIAELREALTCMGRRMDADEVDKALKTFTNGTRQFKYKDFVDALAGAAGSKEA